MATLKNDARQKQPSDVPLLSALGLPAELKYLASAGTDKVREIVFCGFYVYLFIYFLF